MIDYVLEDNLFTREETNDRRARVVNVQSRVEEPEAIYPVPAQDIAINNPSELLIVTPQMVTGEEVQLKITTQYAKSLKDLKSPRSITFVRKFTVV
jgi:hypothetical protein